MHFDDRLSRHAGLHIETYCRENTLLTVKVCTAGKYGNENALREIEISEYIKSLDAPDHPGMHRLRTILDRFEIEGPHGNRHHCLLFAPLGLSLTEVRKLFPGQVFPELNLRHTLSCMLMGIDVLHQAGIVRTGMYMAHESLNVILQAAVEGLIMCCW